MNFNLQPLKNTEKQLVIGESIINQVELTNPSST
jgi:hypothetical protein